MYKTFMKVLIAFFVPSLSVIAHEGHDHSHWSSDFIHMALFLSIIAVVAVAIHFFKKHKAKKMKYDN